MFFCKFFCKFSMCFFKFLMQIFNVFIQKFDANFQCFSSNFWCKCCSCFYNDNHDDLWCSLNRMFVQEFSLCNINSTHKRASSSTSSRSLLPAFRCLWSRTSCGPLLGLCLSHLKPPHCLDLQVGSTIACVSLFSSISRMISGLSLKSHSKWVNHSDNSLSKIHFSTAN